MEAFQDAMRAFHAVHKWDTHVYLFGKKEELRTFCQQQIQNDFFQEFLRSASMEQMDALLGAFEGECAPFATPCLMTFLDALHTQEQLAAPFSKEAVRWFRACGWDFPAFAFEEEEDEEEEEPQPVYKEPIQVLKTDAASSE